MIRPHGKNAHQEHQAQLHSASEEKAANAEDKPPHRTGLARWRMPQRIIDSDARPDHRYHQKRFDLTGQVEGNEDAY